MISQSQIIVVVLGSVIGDCPLPLLRLRCASKLGFMYHDGTRGDI